MLVKKPSARVKIPLIAFGRGHLLTAREALRVGDHFGSRWRAIPKDLPPKSTIYDYFDLWTYDGTLENIHHALYVRCREQAQRELRGRKQAASYGDEFFQPSGAPGKTDRSSGEQIGLGNQSGSVLV